MTTSMVDDKLAAAVKKKMGGEENMRRFADDEMTSVNGLNRPWRMQNGIIRYSVTSDGTTGPKWVKRLGRQDSYVSPEAKELLCSDRFVPTRDVTTELAVLRWYDPVYTVRTIEETLAEAKRCKLAADLHMEAACLSREIFSRRDIVDGMGLSRIVIAHEPMSDGLGSDPGLLTLNASEGGIALEVTSIAPDKKFFEGHGFAFRIL